MALRILNNFQSWLFLTPDGRLVTIHVKIMPGNSQQSDQQVPSSDNSKQKHVIRTHKQVHTHSHHSHRQADHLESWLHMKHHHDQTDIGVKRNHHYLSARLSLYRKAFSVETLNTSGKDDDDERITPKHSSVFADLNNNVLNSVLPTLGLRRKSISTNNIPVHIISYKKVSDS